MSARDWINWEKYYPEDLNKDNKVKTGQDYFTIPVVNLRINQLYSFNFQWVYPDGTVGPWSDGLSLTTSNEASPAVPTDVTVPSTATGSIPVSLNTFPTNAVRVDVIVTGGVFGTATIAHSFLSSGVATISAPSGFYTVQLRAVSSSGITSTVGTTFTITITDVGETIQSPTNPSGFSSKRILAGVEVSWAGTYSDSTFTGFEAINIYAGNSATATSGTFEQVGVLTGNNLKNTIVVPLGTYVVYGQPVYIHAAAVNKSGSVGTIQQNVTSQILGPGRATDADINDGAIVISKLASDVLTVGNLKAGDINATSFIRAGTSSGARVELSSANISGGPLAGFHIYNSAGTAILSAPLTGGLSIVGNITGSSGQFDGDLGASGGNFRVRSGQITALAGQIGGWQINSNALKNNTDAFPNILLDPVESKIHLRTTSGGTEVGNFIKIDTTLGLRIGSGSQPKFTVDMSGNLTAADAEIVGATITTSGSGFGRIKLNGSNNTLEFLTDSNTVAGSFYQFNGGNELILQHGNKTALGYPSSSHYISLNSIAVTLGRTNSLGNLIGGLTIDNLDARFDGVRVSTSQGAPIGDYNSYIRNIGMGTGSKSTSDTDGIRGDIWIQYS